MSTLVIVPATLKPDGTLELAQKPNLPPGPVTVTLQPAPTGGTPQPELADVIDAIRQSQQARGYQGRSVQVIDAQRREGEDEYEHRMNELASQTTARSTTGS